MKKKHLGVVFKGVLVVFSITGFGSCAHRPISLEKNPRDLLNDACVAGQATKSVKGKIWMKAKSSEASGQFPASVNAKGPNKVRLEVENLLGGTEAIIKVDGDQYKVEVPGHAERNQSGARSWGGIPLEWATELFLGRIPCPSADSLSDAHFTFEREDELIVQTKANLKGDGEKYSYRLREFLGRPWVESMRWERLGQAGSLVEFKFSDADDRTRSPQRWEAKSPQGEVKVRWKEREVN